MFKGNGSVFVTQGSPLRFNCIVVVAPFGCLHLSGWLVSWGSTQAPMLDFQTQKALLSGWIPPLSHSQYFPQGPSVFSRALHCIDCDVQSQKIGPILHRRCRIKFTVDRPQPSQRMSGKGRGWRGSPLPSSFPSARSSYVLWSFKAHFPSNYPVHELGR